MTTTRLRGWCILDGIIVTKDLDDVIDDFRRQVVEVRGGSRGNGFCGLMVSDGGHDHGADCIHGQTSRLQNVKHSGQ